MESYRRNTPVACCRRVYHLVRGEGGEAVRGRNIKIPGHALKPIDPTNRYRWECYCGASGTILCGSSAGARERGRRNEHDAHKIEVLRKRGELEEE